MERGGGRGREREGRGERERERERDYFIVRPPAHYRGVNIQGIEILVDPMTDLIQFSSV